MALAGWPATDTLTDVGLINEMTDLTGVVLPAPLGRSRATNSPSSQRSWVLLRLLLSK
jgi:hypothetical protein